MNTKRVLKDHVKKGATFVPPFLATMEKAGIDLAEVDWRKQILPEIFWLAPLIQRHGYRKARRLAGAFVRIVGEECNWTDRKGCIGCMSWFIGLTRNQKARIHERMRVSGLLRDVCDSIDPLYRLYPRLPLKFLFEKRPQVGKAAALETIGPLLMECLFRGEKRPTLVQGLYHDILFDSGRMHTADGLPIYDTQNLADYPDTPESKHAAADVRSIASTIPHWNSSSFWTQYFWQRGWELGACEVPLDDTPPLWAFSKEFLLYLTYSFGIYSEAMTEVWKAYEGTHKPDLYAPLREEILLGLATRIYRLTVQLVSFLPNWTEDIGQVYVRMGTEAYIYWKWLKEKGSEQDFQKFYDYGLGQQKLYMEHLNNYLSDQGLSEEEIEAGNAGLDFLRHHKMAEFVKVRIGGDPLGKNLRALAEEADLREVYALVYAPTSSMVHGMYDSLDRYYLRRCMNPFHCLHRVPFYWTKSPVSDYGAASMLQFSDWVMAEMLADAGIPAPEQMPGAEYLERLYDEKLFEEFRSVPENAEEAERQRKLFSILAKYSYDGKFAPKKGDA